MSLRSLSVFLAIAGEGSLTRAAQRLHLTQPAVGLQLKKLEAQTGVSLFLRTAQGMQLTAAGAALLPLAEKVLNTHQDFHRHAGTLTQSVRGTLSVGTILDPEFLRLGAWLQALLRHAPGIQVHTSHGMSGDTVERVWREVLDVGFHLHPPQNPWHGMAPGVERQCAVHPLARFAYRVVGPAGWASQLRDSGWETLARLPWVGTPPASVHSRLLAQVYGPDSLTGLPLRTVAQVDQEATMLELVRAGVGLSLARDHIALRATQGQGLAMAGALSLDCMLSLVYLHARSEEPLLHAAREAVEQVWAPSGPAAAARPPP